MAPRPEIGREVTTEYDYLPAKLIIRETVRPKYGRCGQPCCQGVTIAPLPPRLVPQSKLGLGLAVHLLLSRFDDHLSYYTLERNFLERFGAVIPRQQMVPWVEQMAHLLLAIYWLIGEALTAGDYLQIDESYHSRLATAPFEIRNPKPEIRKKTEARNPKPSGAGRRLSVQLRFAGTERFGFRTSDFGFLSGFGLRISDFKKCTCQPQMVSPVKVLDPEVKGKAAQGYLWFYSRPGGYVFLEFNQSRGRDGPRERLRNFHGTMQTDGYELYDALCREQPRKLRRIGCLAHSRRRCYKALLESCSESLWFIGQMRQLYQLERQLKDCSPQE